MAIILMGAFKNKPNHCSAYDDDNIYKMLFINAIIFKVQASVSLPK
jgi:hypothetical protein